MKPIKMNYGGEVSVLRQNGGKLPYLNVKDEVGPHSTQVGFQNKEDVEELIRQLQEAMT